MGVQTHFLEEVTPELSAEAEGGVTGLLVEEEAHVNIGGFWFGIFFSSTILSKRAELGFEPKSV